jgi:hypothetical protein
MQMQVPSKQKWLDTYHKSLMPRHRLGLLSDLRIVFTARGRNAILLLAFTPFSLWNESFNTLKSHMILRLLRPEHIDDNSIFINKEVSWELILCFIPSFTLKVFAYHFEIKVRRVFSNNGKIGQATINTASFQVWLHLKLCIN